MYSKAADVKAAFSDGTNNSDSLTFNLTTGSLNVALPDGWKGQFVRIRSIGADLTYLFSTSASATVTTSAGAADGAPSTTRGEFVPNGELFSAWVPYAPDGKSVYFVRIGSAAGSVCVTKASGAPGNNTDPGR